MKAYSIEFMIDGFGQSCLVVAESEETAIEYLNDNYLGVEDDSIKIELVEERMIIETDLSF